MKNAAIDIGYGWTKALAEGQIVRLPHRKTGEKLWGSVNG